MLTPDEVRLLDNNHALLFIRGERPIKDFKYDILKHPNVKETPDGNGKIYIHKKNVPINTKDNFDRYNSTEDEIELLSEEEILKENKI